MKINNIDYTIYKQYGTNENSKIKKHSKSLEEVIKHFVAVDNKHGDYISNVITTGDAVYVSFNGNSDLVPLWYVLNLAYHYHWWSYKDIGNNLINIVTYRNFILRDKEDNIDSITSYIMVNFKDNTDKWRSILDLTYKICQIIDHDFLCKLPKDKTYHEEIQSSVYVLFTGLNIGILPPNIVPLRSGARSFVRSESEKDRYVNELLGKVNKILLKVEHIEKERDIKMDKKYNGVKLITSLDTYLYKDTLNKSVRSANSCFKFRLQTPIKYKILKYNKLYYNIVKDLTFKFRENNNTVEELVVTFKKGVDKSTANNIGQIIQYIIIQDILPTIELL